MAHRTACCVAQALPVIVASLRVACRSRACLEAAARAGSFLHVQQSLLSDLNTSEHSYLQVRVHLHASSPLLLAHPCCICSFH